MFSRYILMVLVFAVGAFRLTQGAFLAAGGLFAMGAGLVILKVAERKPALRPYAYACFAGTAAVITYMLIEGRR